MKLFYSPKISILLTMGPALLGSVIPALSQGLPDGPGKETVAAYCESCHTFASRVGAGYTPDGWRTVMRMMANHSVSVPADQAATVMEYLVKNFPEKQKPAGVDRPGPAKVSIKVWTVPTPGSRPHDPLATRDGAIWYTGQMANVLGRLDPKTEQFKEYPLKTPHAGPHGLVEDKEGNIWYTGNTGALVGKLDPKTGNVTEYKMPDPNATDPHSLVFDQSGILWFTLQNSNMIGRLDPKSEEIKLVVAPTAKSRPYGIQVNSKGVPITVLSVSTIASIDRSDGDEDIACRMRAPVLAAWRSPATISSGMRTSRAAISAGSTRTPGRSKSGYRRAGRNPNRTVYRPSRMSSGTANPGRRRIRSSALTPRRRGFRPG
jgi:virginiamycin B lyase